VKFLAVQRGGHGPSGPMVNTPLSSDTLSLSLLCDTSRRYVKSRPHRQHVEATFMLGYKIGNDSRDKVERCFFCRPTLSRLSATMSEQIFVLPTKSKRSNFSPAPHQQRWAYWNSNRHCQNERQLCSIRLVDMLQVICCMLLLIRHCVPVWTGLKRSLHVAR